MRLAWCLLVAVLVGAALLAACDSGGGMSNEAPNAKLAVSSTEVMVGDTVRLNASESSDPNGDKLSFSWSQQTPDESSVSLSGGKKVMFVADASGDYIPKVEVSDGKLSDSKSVTITATEDTPGAKDSVTVSAEAVTDDGARIDSAAIFFDSTKVGTGYAEQTYAKDPNREVTIRSEEDDYESAEETAPLDSDHSISLEMLEKLPKTVTVPFEVLATDGDSLVAHAITWEDSVVVENPKKSGTAEIPASREEGTLCAQESDLFHQGCITLVPTSDFTEAKEIPVDRKTVTVSVTPEVPYGNASEVDVFIAGDKKFTGAGSADMPKLTAGKSRIVEGNLVTADTANASKLDRLYADTTVSANENIDLSLPLAKLPACSDGIDNDGDGFADENDTRACTDLDGNYDPQDDNEILKGFTRSITRLFNDSTFVSKAQNERTAKLWPASSPLPYSVMVAKGEIILEVEYQVSDTISDQDQASHLKTGESNNNLSVEKTSDVVEDADTANGFVWRRVHGIDRSFFADGPYYALYGWHGSKAHGEDPSSGGKFYYYAELEDGRGFLWSYVYEPEDVPEEKRKSAVGAVVGDQAPALTTPGQCKEISRTDEICRVPAGSDRF